MEKIDLLKVSKKNPGMGKSACFLALEQKVNEIIDHLQPKEEDLIEKVEKGTEKAIKEYGPALKALGKDEPPKVEPQNIINS